MLLRTLPHVLRPYLLIALLFNLLNGCEKVSIDEKDSGSQQTDYYKQKLKAYILQHFEPGILNSFDWNSSVVIKQTSEGVVLKTLPIHQEKNKLKYLLCTFNGDQVRSLLVHEVNYGWKGDKSGPIGISSKNLLTGEYATENYAAGAAPNSTVTRTPRMMALVSTPPPPFYTASHYFENGYIYDMNAVTYFLQSGAFHASTVYDPHQDNDYLDPLYNPGAGSTSLLPVYNANDIRVVDGVMYTIDKYPYKDWGYAWPWWEDIISDEPEPDNLVEYDPNYEWWEQNPGTRNLHFPAQPRPNFDVVYNNYPKTTGANNTAEDKSAAEVAYEIGGQVQAEFLGDPTLNFCCIRISMALNKSGINIPEVPNQTWKGADGKNYIRGINFLLQFLKDTFGEPEVRKTSTEIAAAGLKLPDLVGGINNKGIYVMLPKNKSEFQATGHTTLWSGFNCIGGRCYFGAASQVFIWRLPQ